MSVRPEAGHRHRKKIKGERPILVPVDFSEHSEAALVVAFELASALGAPLTALHVVHDPGTLAGYPAKLSQKKALARLEEVADEMLDNFFDKVKERHPELKGIGKTERLLVRGLPVTRILEVAAKKGARMVVMGSKGATGLKHLLLGSVAEQVLRLATVPVTIVRAQVQG